MANLAHVRIPHDPDCRLCQLLAEGKTETKIGRQLTPLCPKCDSHHLPGGCAVTANKSLCPKCRKNRRVLVSPPSVGRSERLHYGAACAACLTAQGYVRHQLNGLIWWEQAGKVQEEISDEDLFASINGYTGERVGKRGAS